MFTTTELAACRRLVAMALEEDLGAAGDITASALFSGHRDGHAAFVVRSDGVLAGVPAVQEVLAAVDTQLSLKIHLADGQLLKSGDCLASVTGPIRAILIAERTALNFLQRLSGIASLTRRFVDEAAGHPCKILDTRKTTPGWRLLEKYAVRQGGGHNHRMGLYDGILIKDNHLALGWQSAKRSISESIAAARAHSPILPVEIEVDTLDQFDEALASRPDIVLLDNMNLETIREAVRRRKQAPSVLLEISGGVTLDKVAGFAATGVDRISIGALTHSAIALDIGLDYDA